MMRHRIRAHFPETDISTRNSKTIFIADFTERTNGVRKIEVHNLHPLSPNDLSKLMDCLEMINENGLEIDFNIFDDHQFKSSEGRDLEHCEGCIYPTQNHDKSWVILLEIKDCKRKNISEYKDKVIKQIANTVKIFRDKRIITTHKVYGVVSIPQSKIAFDSTIFGMPPDYTMLKKRYNMIFAATNSIAVIDNNVIRFL